MRARDIIGKRVARVDQRPFCPRDTGGREWDLERIVFEDGTILAFVAHESDAEPYVKGIVLKPGGES